MKRLSDRVLRTLRAGLPHGVSRRLDLYRYRTRVRRLRSESLNRVPAAVGQHADLERIERLWKALQQEYRSDPDNAAKYADHELWLWQNIVRAGRLRLHESRPLRILDIGCGPGYFLAATRALGHESYGVDQPEEYFSPVERQVFSELVKALRVREFVSPLLIQRFQGMTLPVQNLDLITGFLICFNRHRQPDEWGVKEWQFFVEDARRHLRPGGWLHLELNPHPERYRELPWYDAPTKAYFESVGAVRNNQVRIQKAS